jgi:hypothetical protein
VAAGALPEWSLDRWLGAYRRGRPPLVAGDGLDAANVPVPAAMLARATGPAKRPKTLPWDAWTGLCATGEWPAQAERRETRIVERTHVSISRESGTGIEGKLRTEKGELPPSGILIHTLVDGELGEPGLRRLVNGLCAEGWGQGRSYGYGSIDLDSIEEPAVPEPTGWVVTLGHMHPEDALPKEGYWRWTGVPVLAHHPETRRALLPHRFATMLLPGACFPAPGGCPYLGACADADIREIPDYLHYGLAPTWPIRPPE